MADTNDSNTFAGKRSADPDQESDQPFKKFLSSPQVGFDAAPLASIAANMDPSALIVVDSDEDIHTYEVGSQFRT